MEILNHFSAAALDALRRKFLLQQLHGGLTEEEFVTALSQVFEVSRNNSDITLPQVLSNATTRPTTATTRKLFNEARIREFFARVDTLGLGRISWDAFSMHAIESLREQVYGERDKRLNNVYFRPFHLQQRVMNGHINQLTEIRVLNKIGRVVKVLTDGNGTNTMELCEMAQNLPSLGIIKPEFSQLLGWDFIPLTVGAYYSNSLACSFNSGYIRLFSIDYRNHFDPSLEECLKFRPSETQTSLHWIKSINNLCMGSRSGVITLWDLQNSSMISKKKLFHYTVTSMRSYGNLLYAASLDTNNSIKCLDLEHNKVRYTFNDHTVGGVLVLESDDNFIFSSGFEHSIVQRTISLPKATPMLLYDTKFPHKGRISALCRLDGIPLLVSGDTRGILKFWDLRMGTCVQTIRGGNSTPIIREDELPFIEIDERNLYHAAPINSISHLETLGKLTVATSRELLVFSTDDFIRPELVDDNYNCRFVFFPNPDFLLTVHDRNAKLWSSVTGMLTHTGEANMTKFDITTCCLVGPLNRQIILGTMGGEVKAFAVASLDLTVNLTPTLKEYIHNSEIIALHTVTKYKDTTIPYVFVITKSSVLFVPLQTDCSPHAVIPFNGVLKRLMPSNQIIKASSVTQNYIFISTSDARVHIINFQDAITQTYTLHISADVEEIIARPISILGENNNSINEDNNNNNNNNNNNFKNSFSEGDIAFFADVNGRIHTAVLRRGLPMETGYGNFNNSITKLLPEILWTSMRKGTSSRMICELLGSWIPSKPGSWTTPPVLHKSRVLYDNNNNNIRRRSRNRSRTSLDSENYKNNNKNNNNNNHHHHHHHSSRKSSLTHQTSKEFPMDVSSSNAVLITFVDRYNILITIDTEGTVRLWDVRRLISFVHSPVIPSTSCTSYPFTLYSPSLPPSVISSSPSMMSGGGIITAASTTPIPITLIHTWKLPREDIIYISAAEHPKLLLPLLLCATGEFQAGVWAINGVKCLGLLSIGREVDTASGGRRFGLPPFILMQSTKEEWGVFLNYINNMNNNNNNNNNNEGATPPPMPRRISHTLRRRSQLCEEVIINSEKGELTSPMKLPSTAVPLFASSLRASISIRHEYNPVGSASLTWCDDVRNNNNNNNNNNNKRHRENEIKKEGGGEVHNTNKGVAKVEEEKEEVKINNGNEDEEEEDNLNNNNNNNNNVRGAMCVVKPKHRRLVTRRAMPFSLQRTGAARILPPLPIAKIHRKRNC